MANDQGYDNEKRGVIFPSDFKKKAIAEGRQNADKLPDGSGSLVVNGVKFYVSSWTKSGANGKFISFSIEEESVAKARQEAKSGGSSKGYSAPKATASATKPAASSVPDFDDDDLPF